MARCFQDTCSIVVTEVEIPGVGPGYAVNARFDDDSSIFCDIDTGGLDVKIGGGLTKDENGVIIGAPGPQEQGMRWFNAADSTWNLGNPTSTPIPDTAYSADAGSAVTLPFRRQQNPLGSNAIALVYGTFQWDWVCDPDIPGGHAAGIYSAPDYLLPYNAHMQARGWLNNGVATDTPAFPASALFDSHLDVSGLVYTPPPTAKQEKSDTRQFVASWPVPAGEFLYLQAKGWYVGEVPGGQKNYVAFNGVGDGLGVEELRVIWIPA